MPLPTKRVKNMSPAELQIAITYWQGITGDPGKKTLAQLKAELAERRGGAGGGGARSLATLLEKNPRAPRAPVNRFDPESNPNQYKREERRRREAQAEAAAAAELKRKKDEFHDAGAFHVKVEKALAALTHRSPGKVDEEELEAAMMLLGQWNSMGDAKRDLWASDDWARANETLGAAMVNLAASVRAVLAAKEEAARTAPAAKKKTKKEGLLGWGILGLGGGRRRRRRRKTRRRRRRRKTRRGAGLYDETPVSQGEHELVMQENTGRLLRYYACHAEGLKRDPFGKGAEGTAAARREVKATLETYESKIPELQRKLVGKYGGTLELINDKYGQGGGRRGGRRRARNSRRRTRRRKRRRRKSRRRKRRR